MKILIVRGYGNIMNIKNYNTQEIGIAKAFINKGIQADIAFWGGKNETYMQEWPLENESKINIYWLKGKEFFKQGIMPDLYSLAQQYDFLWLDEFNQYSSYKLSKLFPEKCFIYHGPYDINYSLLRKIKENFFSTIFAKKKITNNIQVFTKSTLAKEYVIKNGFKKVETIGVGLDTSRFSNPVKLNISKIKDLACNKVLLYIGSIDNRRNILFLIEVFNKIHKNDSECKLLLIGKKEKRYWKKCEKLINKYDLQKDIVYIEKMSQEQLCNVYKCASVFLFPTKYDIFGMVLMEAMYFGIPVISSRNGGSATLINSGANGFELDLDVQLWVDTVMKILSNNDISAKIGTQAKKTINDYSWNCIIEHALKYMIGS